MKVSWMYTTTSAEIGDWRMALARGDDPAPEVAEPEGEGWEMCGAAMNDGLIMWFWRKKREPSA